MLLPLHRVPRLPAEHRRAGRPTQTWNIALMSTHVHGLHLWIVTATTETKSKLCLCFQRHRQKQDQPKYQQITLGARMQFYLPGKKEVNINRLAVLMPDGLFQASVHQTEVFRQIRDKCMSVSMTHS